MSDLRDNFFLFFFLNKYSHGDARSILRPPDCIDTTKGEGTAIMNAIHMECLPDQPNLLTVICAVYAAALIFRQLRRSPVKLGKFEICKAELNPKLLEARRMVS